MIRQDWSTLKKLMFMKTAAGGGAAVEATATGNPLTFLTDLARPLKSLLIPFTPVQSGTGDPSPQNIRSILPWNGLKVFGGGKNLFDESAYGFTKGRWISASTGEDDYNSAFSCTLAFVPCEEYAGMRVTLNKRPGGYNQGIAFYTSASASSYISGVRNNDAQAGNPITFTIPQNAKYMRFTVPNNTTEIQIEAGQTATAYEPYKPITETDISFPSPVYGGTLDVVSGVLTVTHELWTKNTATMNNSVNYPGWKDSGIKALVGEGLNATFRDQKLNVGSLFAVNTTGINDVLFLPKEYGYGLSQDEWIALAIDVQIAVPLATPQEITLTPEQITALKGDNTIWSDADGTMTATYLKKG